MAADRDLTPYQRRVIRNHYRNLEAKSEQRLAELVTEIWLATTEKRRAALWDRARELLARTGTPASEAERIVSARDAEALARLAR